MEESAINESIASATGLTGCFTGDLNAMHEAEKLLVGDDFKEDSYVLKIISLIEQFNYPCMDQLCVGDYFKISRATARQRSEAFLRTLGKWKE